MLSKMYMQTESSLLPPRTNTRVGDHYTFLDIIKNYPYGAGIVVWQVRLLPMMLHAMWILVQVPDAPFLIQLLANCLGTTEENSLCIWVSAIFKGDPDENPGF